MNKKIFYIAALGVMTLGLSSCGDDFLNTSSKTDGNTGNFNQTQAQADILLNGCYDGWQGTVCGITLGSTSISAPTFSFQLASEYMSDECYGGAGTADARNQQVVDRFDISQDASQTDLHNNLWSCYYGAIYNCNELLTLENDYKWASDAEHGRTIGECRAIRGMCYFDLVRMFENVPLITVPTQDNVPQASPDSVYAQIVSDLRYAAQNIPANAYPKANAATNDGRITKYAAEAMLARVYLFYDGYYNNNQRGTMPGGLTAAEALAGLEDVINSGEYKLVPRFRDLWPASSQCTDYTGYWLGDVEGGTNHSTYAGEGNSETVLAMKFNYTGDYNGNSAGNNAIQMFGIRCGGDILLPYAQGWGGATVTPDTWYAYSSGDQRQSASIINLAAEGITNNSQYMTSTGGYRQQREYTGYTIKKYTPLNKRTADGSINKYYQEVQGGDWQISQPQDYIIMRYSDVLLMAAELGSPNAQNYFDQVRRRAFTLDDGTLSPGYQEEAVNEDNILKERRLEFVGEGIRYWDLLRQGIDKAATTIAASSGDVISGGNADHVTITADNIRSKRGFSQIPLTQIQRSNGVLKQNPGW